MKRFFKKRTIRRIVVIIALIVFSQAAYGELYRIFFNPIETEVATMAENVQDSLTVKDALFIRDEHIIGIDNKSDNMSYTVCESDKIAKDGNIAVFFADKEEIIAKRKILKISSKIKNLKQLLSLSSSQETNTNVIDKQITHELSSILKDQNAHDYKNLKNLKEKFLSLITKRQFVTQNPPNLYDKIKALEVQCNELDSSELSEGEYIKSPFAGYFSKKIDGYESSVDYEKALTLTPKDIDNVRQGDYTNGIGQVLGKIISNQKFYIAFKIAECDRLKFKKNAEISLIVPSITSGPVLATIREINRDNEKSEFSVIMECDYLTSGLTSIRKDTIKIVFDLCSGIRVSKNSLHEKMVLDEKTNTEKNILGVYTVYVDQLLFKEVIPIYYDKDYVICDPNPPKEKLHLSETLKEYDNVVSKGKNLHEGKKIK